MYLIFYIYKDKYEVKGYLITSLKCRTNLLRSTNFFLENFQPIKNANAETLKPTVNGQE